MFSLFDREGARDRETALLGAIARNGYAVMTVSPEGGDEPQRWFASTVGLAAQRGWPELVVFGLDHDDMARLLTAAVNRIEALGTEPAAAMARPLQTDGALLRMRRLDPRFARAHLGWANWFSARFGKPKPQALQLLWPDADGRFPGARGCDPAVAERQEPALEGEEDG